MPAVELTRQEAAQGDLPRVCVCCGDAASGMYHVALYGRRLGVVLGPLCKLHRNHWPWRNIISYITLGVCAWLPVNFLWAFLSEWSYQRFGLATVFWIIELVLVPFMAVAYFACVFTAVLVTKVTKKTLTLAGVSPEFIEALRIYRLEKKCAHPVLEAPTPPYRAERCSETVLQILDLANQEAQRLHQDHVGTAFLLFGLSEFAAGVAGHFLRNCSIGRERLQAQIMRQAVRNANLQLETKLPWTPALKRVLLNAIAEADRANRKLADEGYLLVALLQEDEGDAAQILIALGANLKDLRRKAEFLLRANEGIQVLGAHRESIQSLGSD